jgi:hypothetical protein
MRRARAALVARKLTWDNGRGTMRDGGKIVEHFVRQSDHVPHASEEDVMLWEFRRYIANSASRISRGFTP